jgi:N-acetylglucosamine-6-phosphate deacetylase
VTVDGTLAGSDIGMIDAVRNAVKFAGVTLEEALRMASLYPATALGLADEMGRMQAGFRADLIELDDRLNIVGSWINGESEAYG